MLAFQFNTSSAQSGLRTGPSGLLQQVRGADEIGQSLIMLLSTRPGERRLMPDYGCDLDRLLFEPNDETTAGLAMRLVSAAIAQHEPRARIDRMDAGPAADGSGRLMIVLDFTDLRTGQAGSAQYGFGVDG